MEDSQLKSSGKNFLSKVFIDRQTSVANAEKGQSFVEFILLMLVIIGISYGYVSLVHSNLATTWEKMVNVVINSDGTNFQEKVKY